MRLTVVLMLSLCAACPAAAGRLSGAPADLPPALAAAVPGLVAPALPRDAAVRFRGTGGFRLSDGGWAVCGEVRRRNAFGLSTGWTPFYLRLRPQDGGWKLVRRIVDWPADAACRRLATGATLRTAD